MIHDSDSLDCFGKSYHDYRRESPTAVLIDNFLVTRENFSSSERAPEQLSVVDVRIGTFNIHQWMTDNQRDSVESLTDTFRSLSLNVFCMQEVGISSSFVSSDPHRRLKQLSEKLQAASVYAPAYYSFGNAILSTFPVSSWASKYLELRGQEKRSVAMAELRISAERKLRVLNLHLDHRDEGVRNQQMQIALEMVASLPALPTILCGDFNALLRSDYSESEWSAIAEVRQRSGWEAPHTDLLDLLINQHGFVDLRSVAKKITGEIPTCRFKTRIDYILGKHLPADWQIVEYLHDSSNRTSDHKPAVVHIRM